MDTDLALERWLNRLDRRSQLSDDDKRTVRSFPGRLAQFGTTRDVVRLGERTQHCCLIVDGIVGRFGQTSDGVRQLTALYIAGDAADLHSVVLPVVSAPLQSAMHATVIFIPHEAVQAAAAASWTLAQAFWRDCVADAQVASEWIVNLGRRDAASRVAHLLCELAVRYRLALDCQDGFPFPVTQSHLGDATGLTSVHVNRVLKNLREAGAVDVRDRRADILSWDRLVEIAEFDPAYLHLKRE